jgi:hypothetical protein
MNLLTTKHAITLASLATCLIIIGAFMVSYQDNKAMAYPQGYGKGDFSFGTISSIQNDESGNPAWMISGHWKSNLMGNQSSLSSSQEGNATTSFLGASSFDTQFEMVRLNGMAAHAHTITNFVVANTSQTNNMTKVFNGTSTASMPQGPVTNIPTSIIVMADKVISIYPDPSKIENHFGNTPVYGLVMDKEGHSQGFAKGNSTNGK